ncbi:MAG: threonine ammonia-lyase IlvA [Bacillota bacterium]|jgi:threonine dehydratase
MSELLTINMIREAGETLKPVVKKTSLEKNYILSEKYQSTVLCKREDLQIVRSFKLRGAYNKMASLTKEELLRGVVCASAGNHAQGVAYSCKSLQSPGKIFMPVTTPKQKISQVTRFGNDNVEVILTGDTFDDASEAAFKYCQKHNMTFIHPFNDPLVIAGQATVAMEILADAPQPIDYLFMTIGGGGLAAGMGTYFKHFSPQTKIIGVEPLGAASMQSAFEQGAVVSLEKIDKFVDGAAVKKVGDLTFSVCRKMVDEIVTVPEGKVCSTILDLYNNCAMVLEPAGALPVAALDFYREQIKGKQVVCVISGGNNDIDRMQEIKEKSLLYEGLKHYFIIEFPQRPGALKEFVNEVLGPNDDITRFEYTKSNDKEKGPTLVGIELSYPEDYESLLQRLKEKGFKYTIVNHSKQLLNLFV